MGNKHTTTTTNNRRKRDHYTGDVKNNVAHGKGHIAFSSMDQQGRASFHGSFVNGLKQGQGVMTWTDGRTYTGAWWADRMHGKGTMAWTSEPGRTYDGEWIDGQRHGMGHMTFAADDCHGRVSFFGPWVADTKHGHGFMEWRSGAKYLGEWHQGKRHGHGVFMFPNGDQFVGRWFEGRPHGIGRLLRSNGGAVGSGEVGCDGLWLNADSWEQTRMLVFRPADA